MNSHQNRVASRRVQRMLGEKLPYSRYGGWEFGKIIGYRLGGGVVIEQPRHSIVVNMAYVKWPKERI